MKKCIVTLSEDERKALSDLIVKGKQRSQKILNALVLLGSATELYSRRILSQGQIRSNPAKIPLDGDMVNEDHPRLTNLSLYSR